MKVALKDIREAWRLIDKKGNRKRITVKEFLDAIGAFDKTIKKKKKPGK